MIRTLPWTWGTIIAAGTVVGPQWVWQEQVRSFRVYPTRVRDGIWVEVGHSENADPALDTRDS